MMSTSTIALLMRDPKQLENNLSALDPWCAEEHRVLLFLVGMQPGCGRRPRGRLRHRCRGLGIELFTDQAEIMDIYGIERISQKEIARLLNQADLVVPL